MVERCMSCGQPLAADGADDPSIPPEIPLVGEGEAPPPAEPLPGLGRSVLAGVAAFGILWVLASVLSGPSNPSETTEIEAQEPLAVEAAIAETDGVPIDAEGPLPAEVAADGTEDRAYLASVAADDDSPQPREPGSSVDAGVLMLRRHLDNTDQAATLLYRSDEGLSLVDLRSGEVRSAELNDVGEVALTHDSRLLEFGDELIVVDMRTLGGRQTLPSDEQFIRSDSDGLFTIYKPADALFRATYGGEAWGEYPVPEGADVVGLPGYGFVAVTSDDASFVVTLEGLEPLSDHRVLTATDAARLEVRCESALECVLVVVSDEGEATLPSGFDKVGDRYLLSPDGTAILRWDPTGRAEVHVPADSYTTIVGSGMQHPAWSPDSSFVVWLDLENETPQLKVLLHERREWLTWDVATMGAPDPIGPEVTVWP